MMMDTKCMYHVDFNLEDDNYSCIILADSHEEAEEKGWELFLINLGITKTKDIEEIKNSDKLTVDVVAADDGYIEL